MKKLVCFFSIICISAAAFAGSGKRSVPSLDNPQVVKAQKAERRSLRDFGSGRRYSTTVRGRGLHLFGHKGGGSASRPESGLGL